MRAKGFTLLELVTTTAVAAVLGALGVPVARDAVMAYRAHEATATFAHSLALARISAVARNADVVVCPSRNGRDCEDASDWSGGWIVAARLPAQPEGPLDVIEHVQRPSGDGLALRSSGGRRRVVFQASGWASGTNLSLTVCDAQRAYAKVVMNNAGRTRIERVAVRCQPA